MLLGGSVAEELIGRERNTGAGGDIQQTRDLIRKTAIEGSLVKNLDGAMTDETGKLVMNERAQSALNTFVDGVIKDARALAESELRRKWSVMVQVANTLMRKGSITGSEFQRVVKQAETGRPRNTNFSPERIREFMFRLSMRCERLLSREE